jgi:hypothetical protein
MAREFFRATNFQKRTLEMIERVNQIVMKVIAEDEQIL